MDFISKYNVPFMVYINKKYNKKFRSFEDYSLYLFELTKDELEYYYQLEEDVRRYSDEQQERKSTNGKS